MLSLLPMVNAVARAALNKASGVSLGGGGRLSRRVRRSGRVANGAVSVRSSRNRRRFGGVVMSLVVAGAVVSASGAASAGAAVACSDHVTAFVVNPSPDVEGTPDTLWSSGSAFSGSLGVSVAPDTSPAVAPALNGGCAQYAWQAPNGELSKTSPTGPIDLGVAMAAGTSPSMVGDPAGGYHVAVQGSNGDLWVASNIGGYGAPTFMFDIAVPMAAGTSPAAALSSQFAQFAWQGSNGHLWKTGPQGPIDFGVSMMAGTSPSMALLSDGSTEIAFQGGNGDFWTETITAGGQMVSQDWPTPLMDAATSPSVAAIPSGGFDAAYITQSGDVEVMTNGIPDDVSQRVGVVALGTNGPAIAADPVSGGFVVAFEDTSDTEREVTGAVVLGAIPPDTVSPPMPAIVSAPSIIALPTS
jgi:hypothetical protein